MILYVRKYLFALAMAGVSLSATAIFADPVAVDAKTVVTAPNWILGSTWYYSDGYGLKVASSLPGSTEFDRLDAPGQWFSRQGFLRKDLISGTATRTSIFRTIPDQAGRTLRAASPLTFQREYLENGVLMVHATSWSVEGRETITVPAGTFDCWIIVWRSRSLRSDWTGFERWWYSPKAQNYVRMEYKYGPDAEGSRVLMRYQIGTQAAENTGTPQATADVPAPAGTARIEPAALPPAKDMPQPVSSAPVTAENALPGPVDPASVTDTEPPVPVIVPQIPSAIRKPVAARQPRVNPSIPALQHSAMKTKSADGVGPAPAPGRSVWHAQVASSKEQSAVRKTLEKIQRGHAEVLKDIPSGITAARIGDRGTFYRAWLGRFDHSAEAVTLCGTLRAAGAACSVSKSARDGDERLASKL